MKQVIPLILAILLAGPAQAACYVEYKAKQDDPLRLHYGILLVPDTACSAQAVGAVAERRLAGTGWQLLNIISVSTMAPTIEKQNNAGPFYLRY